MGVVVLGLFMLGLALVVGFMLSSGLYWLSSFTFLGGFVGVLGAHLEGGFMLGGFGSSMVLGVLLVFSGVLFFTAVYLGSSSSVGLFSGVLVAFVSGVLMLVGGLGLYMKMVGWEVLGVTSFVLIGYYCTRAGWGSALHTVMLNRIGDISFVILLCWVILEWCFGCVSANSSYVLVFSLVLVLVITKSSQYPFNGWLPLAMAAPTPVSALVHSSTLVVAGLYMGCYFSGYGVSDFGLGWALLTVLIASVSAVWEPDFKKVVALSTSLHLGLMFMMLVAGSAVLMEGHMLFHAFYKSMLFVAVGAVIMVLYHEQVALGSSGPGGPFSGCWGLILLMSVASLSGLFASSGWVTKDIFMERVLLGGMSVLFSGSLLLFLALSLVYCIKLLVVCAKTGSAANCVNWSGFCWAVLISATASLGFLGLMLGGWVALGGFSQEVCVGVNGSILIFLYWGLAFSGCYVFLGSGGSKVGGMFYLSDALGRLASGLGFSFVAFVVQTEALASSALSTQSSYAIRKPLSQYSLLGLGGDVWTILGLAGLGFVLLV